MPPFPAMRFRFNPFLGPAPGPPETSQGPIAFHRSLPEYAPAPLHACPGLARSLGIGGLYLKDESRRFGLRAFKGLGASWALHRLLERRRAEGAPPPPRVATATDGNHGRAVAWAARRAGLGATVFIPAHAKPARVEAIRGEGAEVVLVAGTYDDAVRRCAEESAAAGWQVIADTGYEGYLEIPGLVTEGYSTIFQEIDAQLEEGAWPAPNLVVVQGGVGALAAAAVRHYRGRAPAPRLAVVEPVDADCLLESILSDDGQPRPARGRQESIMAGLNCGEVSRAAWPILRRGVDLFFSIEDRFAEEAMRRLHRPEPGDPSIEAGESGAAGLAGLLALASEEKLRGARTGLGLGPGSAALAIVTEGATDPESVRRILGGPPP